jgi:hypothetical protein
VGGNSSKGDAMTFDDAKVIGGGSLGLLIVFLTIRYFVMGGTLDIWGAVRHYVAVKIMSNDGAGDDFDGAGIGAGVVVPPQQHQSALELVPNFQAVKTYLTDHTLTDEEAIELLALARRSSGDDLLSANKIRDIVGGNEGKVKAHVAAHRKPRPKPRPADRLTRPANGWN